MPVVDLSMMGLEGQQSFYQNKLANASANAADANAEKDRFAVQEAKELEELGQVAAARVKARYGRMNPNDDFNAEDMAQSMSSLADPLEMTAEVMMEAGKFETAQDLLNDASEIRKRESDIKGAAFTQQQTRLTNIQKGAEIAATKLGTAQNEDEWQQGIKEMEALGVIEPELMEKIKYMPYDPDVAEYFRQQGIKAGEQARLELQQQNIDNTEEYRATQTANQDRLFEFAQQRHRDAENHRRTMEKAAGPKGTAAGAPGKDVLASVKRKLLSSVFRGVEGGDVDAAADYIASSAQQMVREDKTISWDTAVGRAILVADKAGMFQTEETGNWIERRLSANFPKRFKGPKAAKFSILPLPQDRAKMKKGQAYQTARGVAVWNGTEFETAE